MIWNIAERGNPTRIHDKSSHGLRMDYLFSAYVSLNVRISRKYSWKKYLKFVPKSRLSVTGKNPSFSEHKYAKKTVYQYSNGLYHVGYEKSTAGNKTFSGHHILQITRGSAVAKICGIFIKDLKYVKRCSNLVIVSKAQTLFQMVYIL